MKKFKYIIETSHGLTIAIKASKDDLFKDFLIKSRGFDFDVFSPGFYKKSTYIATLTMNEFNTFKQLVEQYNHKIEFNNKFKGMLNEKS